MQVTTQRLFANAQLHVDLSKPEQRLSNLVIHQKVKLMMQLMQLQRAMEQHSFKLWTESLNLDTIPAALHKIYLKDYAT
mgnify:CR=1 FL=1